MAEFKERKKDMLGICRWKITQILANYAINKSLQKKKKTELIGKKANVQAFIERIRKIHHLKVGKKAV